MLGNRPEEFVNSELDNLQNRRPKAYRRIMWIVVFFISLTILWKQCVPEAKQSEILDRLDPWKQEQPVFRSTTYIVNPKNSFLIENINNTGDDSKDLHIAFDELSRIATKHGKIINTDTGTFWSVLLWGSPNFDTTDLQDQSKHDLYAGYEVGNMSPRFEVKFSYHPPWVNANLQTSSLESSDSISIKIEGKVTSLQQDSANTIELSISFNYTDTTITTILPTTLKHQEHIGYNYWSFSYRGAYLPSIDSNELISISFNALDAAQNKFKKEFTSDQIKSDKLLKVDNVNLDSLFTQKPIDSRIKEYPRLSNNSFYIPPINDTKETETRKVKLASFPNTNYGLPADNLEEIADITPTKNTKNNYDFTVSFKNQKFLSSYLSMSISLVEIPQKPTDGTISTIGVSKGFTQRGSKFLTNFTFKYPQIYKDDMRPSSYAIVIVVKSWSEESPVEQIYYYNLPINPEIVTN